MKKIEAVIKPFKLDEAVTQIDAVTGVKDIDVLEAKDYTPGIKGPALFFGSDYRPEFLPRVKLEIIAEDDSVGKVIQAIQRSVLVGREADYSIEVKPIEQYIDIGSGEIFEVNLERPVDTVRARIERRASEPS